jgi:hypothetical protein
MTANRLCLDPVISTSGRARDHQAQWRMPATLNYSALSRRQAREFFTLDRGPASARAPSLADPAATSSLTFRRRCSNGRAREESRTLSRIEFRQATSWTYRSRPTATTPSWSIRPWRCRRQGAAPSAVRGAGGFWHERGRGQPPAGVKAGQTCAVRAPTSRRQRSGSAYGMGPGLTIASSESSRPAWAAR